MKVLLPLLVLLLLAVAGTGQSVKAKIAKFDGAKFYSVNYDPTANTTLITSPEQTARRSNEIPPRTLEVWTELRFPGTEPKGNATLDLVLVNLAFSETFREDHHLSLNVDGKAIDIGDGTRSVRKGPLFDYVETMTYRLTAEQLAVLSRAKTVAIHIEQFEGPLRDETVATVRNMISLMN